MVRPVRGSMRVCSDSAMPMPITMPPRSWLAAVLGLITRPTSNTPSQRETRTSPVSASTRTSQKCAPRAAFDQRWSLRNRRRNSTWPASLPTPGVGPDGGLDGRPARPRPTSSRGFRPTALRAAGERAQLAASAPRRRPAGWSRRWRSGWSRRPSVRPGSSESPYSTRTASNGTPSASAAICACTVAAPMPISWKPQRTSTRAVGRSRTVTLAVTQAGWNAVATPMPTSQRPSRIERGSGVRSRPAEPLGAHREGLPQLPVGERLAVERVGVRLVAHPQLDRVHAQLVGELVDRRLQRERADRLAGRAHPGVRRAGRGRRVLLRQDVRRVVEVPRRRGGLLGHAADPRRRG